MQLVDIAANPLPADGRLASVRVSATVSLRVATWLAPPDRPPAGTVAILPGRSEFIEKYAEVVADLLARHLSVVVIDWRGQGGSSRLLADRRRGHVGHFDEYRADLEAVVADVLARTCPRPFFALAHSMGGAIVLDQARRGASLFDRIVLSAPMLDIHGLRFPRATRAAVATATALGRGTAYVPGGSGQSWMVKPFAGNALTSDPGRYTAFQALALAAPDLLVGAPTFGWVDAAFRAMAALMAPEALAGIAVPILAVACGADRVVTTTATERAISRVKIGQTLVIRHALHEILMEQDVYRQQFWAAFDRFIPGSPH